MSNKVITQIFYEGGRGDTEKNGEICGNKIYCNVGCSHSPLTTIKSD